LLPSKIENLMAPGERIAFQKGHEEKPVVLEGPAQLDEPLTPEVGEVCED
jgi:hypothetical protein